VCYRRDIEEEKDKARNKGDDHLCNYKMHILEGGCHSRETRFRRKVAVCIICCGLYLFYVIYMLERLKKSIWCHCDQDIIYIILCIEFASLLEGFQNMEPDQIPHKHQHKLR
jgi:hypothetical protein